MLGKHFVFIDSLQFMSSSLHTVVNNLPNDAFKYTSEEIKNDKKLKVMNQKGVYPYDYMDSFNRFREKNLPIKTIFTSNVEWALLSPSYCFPVGHYCFRVGVYCLE